MKISLNWIKDYVKFNLTTEQLIHKLTMAGLEVEKVHSVGDDTVFELEITPNRPDCLNMIGMARELSAILNKPLQFPKVKQIKFPKQKVDLMIEDKKDCVRYMGVVVKGVSVKSSGDLIQKRISAIGTRAINNVVDVTNFCLMENGQPLHAFDLDKLEGGKIIVRRARQGEKIVTLDGVERVLDSSILVIADARRPVAIAGIMGGKDTEVSVATKNILSESANFDQVLIRRAARKLGLTSDSSYRFERGIPVESVEAGSLRALDLILKEAGGSVVQKTDLNFAKKAAKKAAILISQSQINSYLGSHLPIKRSVDILTKLGFKVSKKGKDGLSVSAPLHRGDVRVPVDVIEEVARVVGYDQLPSSLPVIKAASIHPNPKFKIRKTIRELLTAQGFSEIITYTMIDQKSLQKTNFTSFPTVRVKNPLSQEQEFMRSGILPGHLAVVSKNLNKGQKDLKFFEIGKKYTPDGEKEVLAIVVTGSASLDWRQAGKKDQDFFDLKGAVESVFQKTIEGDVVFKKSDFPAFESSECAEVFINQNNSLGHVGKIREEILSNWGIKQKNVFAATIDLEKICAARFQSKHFVPIPEYPAVIRDVSLAVNDDVQFAQIREIILKNASENLAGIEFKELYTGEKISVGQRGIVFSLIFQSKDRTLRDEEVTTAQAKIVQSLGQSLGAAVR